MSRRAVILSGSLGMGHDMMAELLSTSLTGLGWESETLDCMGLLGGIQSRIGDRVFRRLSATPSVYDSLHFSHFRPGSRLAMMMDNAATQRLVPAVRAVLDQRGADLLISAFATGASTAAKLAAESPDLTTVVLCTDAAVHRFWAWPEIDLFLVTSGAAAASVRRYVPSAATAVVPPPVRGAFYQVRSQPVARLSLGIAHDAPCVLLMGGGWGLGPLATSAEALAAAGTHVLAVAGRNSRLESHLRSLALENELIHPYGFTDEVPQLMAASDLVVTTPGATTCSEARVVGRNLVLLDVIPGHGRENLQHELEAGGAEACDADPNSVTASVLAALTTLQRPLPTGMRSAGEWDEAFAAALGSLDRLGTPRSNGAGTERIGSWPPAARHDGGNGQKISSRGNGGNAALRRALGPTAGRTSYMETRSTP